MEKANQHVEDRKAAAAEGNDRHAYERTPFGRRRIIGNKHRFKMMSKYLLTIVVTSAIFVCRRFGFAKVPVPVSIKR